MGRRGANRQGRAPRPLDVARHVRAQARRLHAPPTVKLVCDYFVDFFANRKHLKQPHCRVSYGRHSEKERAWDQKRCAELVEAGLAERRLVRRPPEPREGLAELLDMSRRSAIRDGQWLEAHGLVRRHYTQDVQDERGRTKTYGGTHPVPARHSGPHAGITHEIGVGGCLPDGTGLATEWRLVWPGAPPPPGPPPDPDPDGEREGRLTRERMAEIRQAAERARGP